MRGGASIRSGRASIPGSYCPPGPGVKRLHSAAMPAADRLAADLRRALAARADATRARAQQAYMKSEMPYYGLGLPDLRVAARAVFDAHPLSGERAWRRAVLGLWRGATRREERYAAIALTGHRLYRDYQTPLALPMYEEIVVSGAWWDYVDEVAVHRLGPILASHPAHLGRELLAWAGGDDLWKRRSAIIAQVARKKDTDLYLLYACIEPSLSRGEFWLRKAIGWALRAYAWHDPGEVKRYVAAKGDALSGLSRREALKNVGAAPKKRAPKRR